MDLPILESCTRLVLGSGTEAMMAALTLREAGEDVLLVSQDTFLYAELTHTGDWRMPRGLSPRWESLLFPDSVREPDGTLHPDRLKRWGEALFAERGVRILYACQVLGVWEGAAAVAHKSGLFGVRCTAVHDLRREAVPADPCAILHTMEAGVHRTYCVPAGAGNSPRELFDRYEAALSALPAGASPARSGAFAAPREGFVFPDAPDLTPVSLPWPAGDCIPRMDNPLREGIPTVSFPGAAVRTEEYDVVIIGGGTAGAAAAFSCAELGLRTLVADMQYRLGGSGTVGGVSIYWFGTRDGVTARIDGAVDAYYRRLGLPRQTCHWSGDDVFLPDLKAQALLGLCLDAGAEVRFGCTAFGAETENGRVTGVYYAQNGIPCLARARMVLDCTGDGDICMFAGAAHTYGSEGDGMTYWGSLAQFTTPDDYRNNFSTMVHVGDPLDYTRFIRAGRLRGEGMYDHGTYVAVRESRHIACTETVTLEDITAMRPVRAPLYTCFSNYDPKGRLTADMAYFGLLPPNQRIAIPRGAVIPVDGAGRPLEGILVGGKAIGCTHDAFPGIRMQPDIQQQGLALAALAFCCIRENASPADACGVEDTVRRMGGVIGEVPSPPAGHPADAVAAIDGTEPWEWLDAPPDSWAEEVSPVIRIMTARAEEVLPALRAAHAAAADEARRLSLARLLLWHGDAAGAETVIGALERFLAAEPGLPRRSASVNYGQMLPDHGLMPEAVYLFNSLSRSGRAPVLPLFAELLRRLESAERSWFDLRAGIYPICESFAYVAVGRQDREMLPLLRRLLELPEFDGEPENELLRERLHMLRITLLHALRVLGDPAGTEGLRGYLADPRRILARAAAMLLQ